MVARVGTTTKCYTISTVKKTPTRKRPLAKIERLQRHARLLFVPHRDNQFRPHATRRHGLLGLLLLVIGLQFGYNFSTSGTVLGQSVAISSYDLLTETNSYRQREDLPDLAMSTKLSQAAFLKAQDMIERQYWAHAAPDGTQPWKWLGDVDYNYVTAGENLAKNFNSADAVMAAWMNSPDHRANVLGKNYRQVGFAVIDGELEQKPVTLIVAMYGDELTPTAVAGTQTEFIAPPTGQQNLVSRIGTSVQSLTPAALGSIVLVLIAAITAFAAHLYRHQLPKHLKQSWYRHHGAYKSAGLMSFLIVIVSLYGGGQL